MFKTRSDSQQSTTNFLLGCITAGVGILVYLNLEKRFPALQNCEEDFANEADSLKDRVRSGASHLRHRFEAGVDTLKRKASDFRDRAEDSQEGLEESASRLGERVREGAKDLKERVENTLENVREDIRENQADQQSNDTSANSPGSNSGDRKSGNSGIIPPATL